MLRMFSKLSQRESAYSSASSAAPLAATVIAKGVKVEGDFASEGDVVIEGQVNGSLSTSGRLTVGNDAVIKANVKASEAHIAGTIEGNTTVEHALELSASARILGDIVAQTISVESGAAIEGNMNIGEQSGSSSAAHTKGKASVGKNAFQSKSKEESSEDDDEEEGA